MPTTGPAGHVRLSAREVRASQLRVLDALLRWCAEEGATCYAAYGTLLGARRHEGYIPWDDDIDVMMPRTDYERLRAQRDVIGAQVGGARGDRAWLYPNVKLCDRSTVVLDGPFPARIGVNVDVFPLDSPHEGRRGAVQARVLRALVLLVSLQSLMPREGRRPVARLAARVLQPLARAVPRWIALRWLDDVAADGPPGGRVGVLVGSYQWSVAPEVLGRPATLPFEGRRIPVPQDVDAALETMYGADFMTPPPESGRVTHHAFTAYRRDPSEPTLWDESA